MQSHLKLVVSFCGIAEGLPSATAHHSLMALTLPHTPRSLNIIPRHTMKLTLELTLELELTLKLTLKLMRKPTQG